MYPLVRELAATDALIRVPVAVTCRVLGFSKQAFYAWEKHPVCDRAWEEAHLINAAVDAHRDDPAFGYRFIADELAEQGFTASPTAGLTAVLPAAAVERLRQEARAEPPGRAASPR